MSTEDGEPDGELVDAFLRYLRGQGPRPVIADPDRATPGGTDDLFLLLEAIAGTGDVADPPLEEDPVAIRLGLVEGPRGAPAPPVATVEGLDHLDPIEVSLDELARRLGGDLEVVVDPSGPATEGPVAVRAECRTLGEVVLVGTIDGDDFASLPAQLAGVFARRPATTAVAAVSRASHLAVVLTEADCVRAIDPLAGWVGPALPRAPEPFGLALGRYLERSIPRWEAVTRLDDMLVLAHDHDDVAVAVDRALHAELDRPARIPAKRAAREELRDLPAAALVAMVEDVRSGVLRGDSLVGRIRELAGAGAP